MIDTDLHLFLPSIDVPGFPLPGLSQTWEKENVAAIIRHCDVLSISLFSSLALYP